MGTVRDGLRPVRAELDRYITRLGSTLQLGAVVLFGSRARNDHWQTSDIDLLVISNDFAGRSPAERMDILLEPWPGIPALEPFGVTPDEACGPGWLLLWDALSQGVPLRDDGCFARARECLQRRIARKELTPTATGWRERLSSPCLLSNVERTV